MKQLNQKFLTDNETINKYLVDGLPLWSYFTDYDDERQYGYGKFIQILDEHLSHKDFVKVIETWYPDFDNSYLHFEAYYKIFIRHSLFLDEFANPSAFADTFIHKKDLQKIHRYMIDTHKEKVFHYFEDNPSNAILRGLILNGYPAELYINHESTQVRTAVAIRGVGLDVLIHDKSAYVRRGAARHPETWEILENDKDEDVQRILAYNGYKPEVMIQPDKGLIARKHALRHLNEDGRDLTPYLNDSEYDIRYLAGNMLKKREEENEKSQ